MRLTTTGASAMTGICGLPEEIILIIEGYSALTRARFIWRNEAEGGIEFVKTTTI